MQRVGFIVVYLGFGYGLLAGWFAARGLPRTTGVRTWSDVAAALCGVGVIVGFSLPSISGFPDGDLNGWRGLDAISVVTSVALVVGLVAYAARPGAGGEVRRPIIASLSGSLAALVLGNAIIQTVTDRGTSIEHGLVISAVSAGVAAAIALLGFATDR